MSVLQETEAGPLGGRPGVSGLPVVLVVEDEPVVRAVIRRSLVGLAGTVREAAGFHQALVGFGAGDVDVVLLDVGLGDADGYQLLQRFKSAAPGIPVIMVTGRNATADVAYALALGAHDHISKPFQRVELVARVQAAWRVKRLQDELNRRVAELDRLARVDALTGVGNRRHMDEMQESCMSAAERHGQPLGLLLVDVDHLKAVNDQGGHAAGDAALKAVTRVLKAEARVEDFVGRWGGDEFLVLLPDTDRAGVESVAERLCRAVAEDAAGRPHGLSVSIGAACAAVGPAEALLRAADGALRDAKRAGRNRIAVSAGLRPSVGAAAAGRAKPEGVRRDA